jgi:NAD(P)-dependent dehydrogenase (short-subunit alcohol dehydrogenase family)
MKALAGKTAIITGANQGLGLAVSSEFLRAGASIIMCARNAEKLKQSSESLLPLVTENQVILALPADVSSQDSVNDLIKNALTNFAQIHILVNNAGIYGPMGSIEEVNWDEWVQAIKINFLGSVLMCKSLIPHFKSYHYGKIIQLSGGGATNPLPRISAYAASKAAVIRFAETLAEEVRGTGIDINSIAPGALNTRLLDQVLEAGKEKVGADFYERALRQKADGGASLEKAAKLAVFLASAESDGITGKLISAVWDPWESFPEHLEELKKSDVYTLRRITPAERGMNWGEKIK